ncbi:TPA: HAMP domain-containing protein [Morganella morganii]
MRVKVRKSLTIKQMSVVAAVTLVTIALFMTLLLSHLIQQRKDDYINQLYNSSVQVRKPLADALLGSDLNAIKSTLMTLRASGILGRAIVMTPENVQVISLDFATHRPIPGTAKMIFGIPVEIKVPLYAYGVAHTGKPPQGYLILQVDDNRIYRFAMNIVALMVTSYLLLALVLVIAISWCINRLIVRPLRKMARELNSDETAEQLSCSAYHADDELGLLAKGYRNQLNKHKPESS